MEKNRQDTLAQTRKTLEPAWECRGNNMSDWVCPDGRRLGEHTGPELGCLADALKHRARLHLRQARRLARAAKTVSLKEW
jgi:hypothetical protein